MAKFCDVPRYFVRKKALYFFTNLVRNFRSQVLDADFFDVLEASYSEAEVLHIIQTTFRKSDLKRLEQTEDLDLDNAPIQRNLRALWNSVNTRATTRIMLEEMALHAIKAYDEEGEALSGDAVELRFNALSENVQLNEIEREILLLAFLIYECELQFPFSINSFSKPYYFAMALDRSYNEVRAVLKPNGRLRTFGLLCDDWDLNSRLSGYFNGAEDDSDILKDDLYRLVNLSETLPLSYYGTSLETKADLLLKLLAKGGKLNVLFYGAPGTGKTCFAKTLAKLSGRQTYEIMQDSRDDRKIYLRSGAIKLCNEREDASSSLLIIDEADELLRDGQTAGGKLRTTEKGITNTLLDSMQIPAIWIANTPSSLIDKSVRRRFDYSIAFMSLNGEQRIQIWKNSINKQSLDGLISEENIKVYSKRYMTNAGGIAFALENLKRLNPAPKEVDAYLTTILDAHCQLMKIDPPEKTEAVLPVADYSLEGVNVKSKISLPQLLNAVRNFADQAYVANDPDLPRMNILLSGVPGSGKTEFVKYLGKEIQRKVLFKRVSDILSPYVGETERNINEAFRQAERENAILFFDEVDSLLQDRSGAVRSWEVTQVNELLQQMEAFKGILIAATNRRKALDAATIRRFTFKLEFDYLTDEGKRIFFERIFKTALTDEEFVALSKLETLVPGDFRTVRQAQYYLGSDITNTDRIAALKEECAVKPIGPSEVTPIGFMQIKKFKEDNP